MASPRRRQILTYSVVCLLVAALFGNAAQPAWAAPDSDGSARDPSRVSVELTSQPVRIHVGVEPTGDVGPESHDDVPPGGGCTWEAWISVDAWYLEGILVQTDSYFSGDIYCVSTAPGQTMTRLTMIAKLYNNTILQREGNLAQCRHVLVDDPLCTGAFSGGVHKCFGQQNCVGIYQAITYSSAMLPVGWAWFEPEPDDPCFLLSERELGCIISTDTVQVLPYA